MRQDFSIAKDETVNFAGDNSYLNVVLGANRSEIYGAITGSQANVYLVNPNGILVGDGATINVGSLHLSTADISGSVTDFTTAQTALNSAVDFKGDVVNKGILTAAQDITVDGDNVTFKNVADVTAPNSAPAPAAVVPSVETVAPAAPEPAATQEDNKQEDSVETASTTATTHGDSDKQEETAQPVGEKQVVHNVLDGDGILTVEKPCRNWAALLM